jgi:ABC-type transport system substrate-binding protein
MAEASYPNGLKNKDGLQNYSRWSNKACHDLVKHIDRELATEKRKAIARQAEMLMEQYSPLLPVSWEKINGS